MGMKYLLWTAPFVIGNRSEFLRQHPDSAGTQSNDGCYSINALASDAMDAMLEKDVAAFIRIWTHRTAGRS